MNKLKITYASFIILALVLITSCSNEKFNNSASANSIIGVWQYLEDDVLKEVKGMSFFTEKHFAFVVNYKQGNGDSEDKILAYSGTYTLEDSIVTATIKYAHNPALTGHNLRWIHGTQDAFATYKVLDSNDNIIETGKLRRLE
jgi:hypothetical protein